MLIIQSKTVDLYKKYVDFDQKSNFFDQIWPFSIKFDEFSI